MRNTRRIVRALSAIIPLTLAAGLRAQPVDLPSMEEGMRVSVRLRTVGMAAYQYALEHNQQYPEDLASALGPEHVKDAQGFVYLASGGIRQDDFPWDASLIVAHQALDKGVAVPQSEQNPEGKLFALYFLDGHTELRRIGDAERLIANSKKVFDAARKGTAFPADAQALWNVQEIGAALRAYMKANGGVLPPDLGATLEFAPERVLPGAPGAGAPEKAGRAEVARCHLSPRAQGLTTVPEEPTADWVRAHSDLVYTGAGKTLAALRESGRDVIVHGPMDETYDVPAPPESVVMVPYIDSYLNALAGPVGWMREMLDRQAGEKPGR